MVVVAIPNLFGPSTYPFAGARVRRPPRTSSSHARAWGRRRRPQAFTTYPLQEEPLKLWIGAQLIVIEAASTVDQCAT